MDSGASEVRAAVIPANRTAACAPVVLASGSVGDPLLTMDSAGSGILGWAGNRRVTVARWSAGTVSCAAAPGTAPAPAPAVPSALLVLRATTVVRTAKKPVVGLRVRCAQASACRGPAALGAGRLTLATGRLELAARSTGTLVLRPRTAKARARLRRRGTLNALLGVRLAQAGAASTGVALPVRLRLRR